MVRENVFNFFLWWAVLGFGIWVGGTIFSMAVVVPMWSESPPESVYAFFGGTSFNKYIFNFFGPPWMAARILPVIVALVLGWHSPQHRRYLLVTCATLVLGIGFTIVYVYPINEVLMAQAGADRSAQEIRSLVDQWVWADRIRFVVMSIGYVFLLMAFRLTISVNKLSRASKGPDQQT